MSRDDNLCYNLEPEQEATRMQGSRFRRDHDYYHRTGRTSEQRNPGQKI